ncbi:MAG: MGMT family protein [Actinomycetota bacterium]
MGPRERGTAADRYTQAAALVRAGEWTSYGDISAAVHGSGRAARAVGGAAATSDSFPNAHRVLRSDGTIAPRTAPHSDDPLAVRARLESEGISFDARGRADPRRRVHWDELQRRAGAGNAVLER